MRLRSPAEFYIKALCCHPDNYDAAAIKDKLIDVGLDFISDDYLGRVRAKMHPPEPFYPDDRSHMPSFGFLVREKINSLFQPDVTFKAAQAILDAPRAKEFVETMTLVHAPKSLIADFITKNRGLYCDVAVLDLYSHYFWNINLLDSTQMRLLLRLRSDILAEVVPEFKDRKKALEQAYYKDPRKVAADLPYSKTSAILAQMRLGLKPLRGDIAGRMAETRDLAWLRAAEAAAQDGPADSQKFLNYANGGRILEELLQMVSRPEDQLRNELKQISLRTETGDVPSIHQLSGGQHTVEISPIKEDDDDDDSAGEPQAPAVRRDGDGGERTEG